MEHETHLDLNSVSFLASHLNLNLVSFLAYSSQHLIHAALLASQIVAYRCSDLLLTMITVINNRLAFKDRNFSSVVNDILFSFFSSKLEGF
jgi:hypothetical protein